MKAIEPNLSDRLERLASKHDLSLKRLQEYSHLFQKHGIPLSLKREKTKRAKRIIMVSTHGYWGDPPPAGVPDTGGQTYYVLEISKALVRQGRQVVILARWFKPYPRVETFAKNLWLMRIKAGGDEFVRKEDIYPLIPEMAETSTAISLLFGAHLVMGHYADGMAGSVEIGERLKLPVVVIPHSLGIRKVKTLGYDPYDPESWHDPQYNFWMRESLELAALKGANFEIANTIEEPNALKKYYGIEYPHIVMPAGAGNDFFDAYRKGSGLERLARFGLDSKKYIIFFGRLSEAKNIPAVVSILGESRKIDRELFRDVKLAIVGGDPEKPHKEELVVKNQIKSMMRKYKLTGEEVIFIPNQKWQTLSTLARHSLFYVGMQLMEPFGMSVAEAMAAGTPVMISKAAGITKWLTHGENAIIVDPENPRAAARRLVKTVKDKSLLKNLSLNGHHLAKETFSWIGIAKYQADIMDHLHQGRGPSGTKVRMSFLNAIKKKENRAYHRSTFVWRGDIPTIKDKHKKVSRRLASHIQEAAIIEKKVKRRVVVALGGESGVGKSEVAEYLRFSLRGQGLWASTIAGDAFFKLTPSENHKARLKAYREGKLKEYLGPDEVDMARLESAVHLARQRKNKEIFVPSDCRSLHSRRYENVPMDLSRVDVILVDLTYSLLLSNANLKVFFESDYKKRLEEIRERNISRDPDQDFSFILKVLEIEHDIIQNLRKEATHIVTNNYDVVLPD